MHHTVRFYHSSQLTKGGWGCEHRLRRGRLCRRHAAESDASLSPWTSTVRASAVTTAALDSQTQKPEHEEWLKVSEPLLVPGAIWKVEFRGWKTTVSGPSWWSCPGTGWKTSSLSTFQNDYFKTPFFMEEPPGKDPCLWRFTAYWELRVCYLLWGSQPACDMCRGGSILSPCARRRHSLRKWSSMSCPRSHTLQMAELGFEPSISESGLFYYTSFKVPEDCTEKDLQRVWGFWGGSLDKEGFELGWQEWIILCPTDTEEQKNAEGRVVWTKGGDEKWWQVTRELKTVTGAAGEQTREKRGWKWG